MATESTTSNSLWLKLAISLGFAALFAWLVSRGGVPLLPSAKQLASIKPSVVLGYVGLFIATMFFRASRWRYLIRPIKHVSLFDSLVLNWIGFFAIFMLPLRLGEFTRPALTKFRHGISVSAGLGTVAVERVVDGLLTSLCVGWAVFAVPTLSTDDPIARGLPFYGTLAFVVFVGGLIFIAICVWQQERAVRVVYQILSRFSGNLAFKVSEKLDNLIHGFRVLRNPALTAGFLVETLIYWVLCAVSMWWLANGCNVPISLSQAVASMGILALGVLLPAGPGLFGNFQLATSTALRLFLVESVVRDQGSLFIFLLYTCQAVLLIIFGVLPSLLLGIRLKELISAPSAESSAPTHPTQSTLS